MQCWGLVQGDFPAFWSGSGDGKNKENGQEHMTFEAKIHNWGSIELFIAKFRHIKTMNFIFLNFLSFSEKKPTNLYCKVRKRKVNVISIEIVGKNIVHFLEKKVKFRKWIFYKVNMWLKTAFLSWKSWLSWYQSQAKRISSTFFG